MVLIMAEVGMMDRMNDCCHHYEKRAVCRERVGVCWGVLLFGFFGVRGVSVLA